MLKVSIINGMGKSVYNPTTGQITNTGATERDLTTIYEDFVTPGAWGTSILRVIPTSPLSSQVVVTPGVALVHNDAFIYSVLSGARYYRVINTTHKNITLPPNPATDPRYCSVFIKLDKSLSPNDNATNLASFHTVLGVPAANPVPPNPPVDGALYFRVADVWLSPSYTTITANDIRNKADTAFVTHVSASDGIMSNGMITVNVDASGNVTGAISRVSPYQPITFNIYGKPYVSQGHGFAIPKSVDFWGWQNAGFWGHHVDLFVYVGYNVSLKEIYYVFSPLPNKRYYPDFNFTNQTSIHYGLIGGAIPDPSVHEFTNPVVVGRITVRKVNNAAGYNYAGEAVNFPIKTTELRTYTASPINSNTGTGAISSGLSYIIDNSVVHLWINDISVNSTGNKFEITLPIPAKRKSSGSCSWVIDNNGTAPFAQIFVSFNDLKIYPIRNLTNPETWATSGTKTAGNGYVCYPI